MKNIIHEEATTSQKLVRKIPGGLCAIEDVWVSGVHAGFKKLAKDLALIFFPKGATMTAVFTQNAVQSHHIQYDKKLLNENSQFKAIMINSGNANTFNGPRGDYDVHFMASVLADQLGIQLDEILICSTGVIGVPMNLDSFDDKVDKLIHQMTDGDSIPAAEAIMTTDTSIKQVAYAFEIDGQLVHLAAIAKGAGMIHPNLGTLLSYIVTDFDLGQATFQQMLQSAVVNTFNQISVDGDTSPNDTIILASTNKLQITPSKANISAFYQQLEAICLEMAQLIVKDGEGASKFVEVQVYGAGSQKDAVKIAKQVATSSLVKTAILGQDANWGRVISAVGQAQPSVFQADKVSISFQSDKGSILTCEKGAGRVFDENLALAILSEKEIVVAIDIGVGEFEASVWTADMTEDYIKINANYRS